jgi:hypothetical protein
VQAAVDGGQQGQVAREREAVDNREAEQVRRDDPRQAERQPAGDRRRRGGEAFPPRRPSFGTPGSAAHVPRQ